MSVTQTDTERERDRDRERGLSTGQSEHTGRQDAEETSADVWFACVDGGAVAVPVVDGRERVLVHLADA